MGKERERERERKAIMSFNERMKLNETYLLKLNKIKKNYYEFDFILIYFYLVVFLLADDELSDAILAQIIS